MPVHIPKGAEGAEQATEPQEQENLMHRLHGFVGELQREANRRVGRRSLVEQRWIADLMQKHGKYDHDTLKKLKDRKKSRLFINKTRTKTNSLSARLSDILFPVDDRNWAIGPTPVPEVDGKLKETSRLLADAQDTAVDAKNRASEAQVNNDAARQQIAEQDRQVAEEVIDQTKVAKEELERIREEVGKRAELMQDEIEDQFSSCKYVKSCRRVISDACDVGIGVMKGPTVGQKPRPRWKSTYNEETGRVSHQMEYDRNMKPAMERVDYWGFFPDPDFQNHEDGDGVYERHLMNASKVRKLQRRADIDKEALRRVLMSGPSRGATPTYLAQLNDINQEKTSQMSDLYIVWEYTGPIEGEQIKLLMEAYGKEGLEEYLNEDGEVDPLAEMSVRIWFCDNEILSFGLNPLESGESLYSVFTLEPDENSPYGFGIPYLMRNPQALLNASFRMMSDNAGLGAAPQVVVNDSVVEPVNGSWVLEGGKLWRRKTGDVGPNSRPFETYDIPVHQEVLANMIALAQEACDDATYPAIAQGEQGAEVTKTFQGMAMLMNTANIVFRRWVKNFDDGITKPDVRRMYDFNMQFSEKEEIKGDFDVEVRGSSVLLVRELQAQNIMIIVDRYTDHPVYGPMLKERSAFEHLLRSNMLPVNEMLRSEEDYEAEIERRRNQPSPEVMAAQIAQQDNEAERQIRREEIAAKREMSTFEWTTRMQISQMEQSTELQKVAQALGMKYEELKGKMQIAGLMSQDKTNAAQIAADQKDRSLATEVAMRDRTGESAGGAV